MALSTAFTMLLMMLQASGDPRMAEVLTWIAGSTYNATGGQVTRTAIVMVILLAIVPLCRRWLTILPLGGDAARAVGMALTPSRIALLALAACLTATATMTIGPLSFVGLMAPHIARMLGFRRTMPHMVISALAGAFYWSLPTGAAGWRYFRIRSRRTAFKLYWRAVFYLFAT
ncbi:iron-hydroxamate transporter permease subunit [Salmonella enterica subsp. enterica serovar Hartford]|nr:iron-hydroxamate transporter permease subunit [Salmonella enterica subsp. enterica serovar Hartford]